MSFLDRLFGNPEPPRARPETPGPSPSPAQTYGQTPDEQALARYHYMLRTAPPETIEEAHCEAFERLTPEQRRLLLEQLRSQVPAAERAAADRGGEEPGALARLATRAELRQPGTMARVFGSPGSPGMAGPGLGGLMAGSFLGSIAGTVVGSMIAQQFFSHHGLADIGASGSHDAFSALTGQPGQDAGHPAHDVASHDNQTADSAPSSDELVASDDLGLGGSDFDGGGFGDTFDV